MWPLAIFYLCFRKAIDNFKFGPVSPVNTSVTRDTGLLLPSFRRLSSSHISADYHASVDLQP